MLKTSEAYQIWTGKSGKLGIRQLQQKPACHEKGKHQVFLCSPAGPENSWIVESQEKPWEQTGEQHPGGKVLAQIPSWYHLCAQGWTCWYLWISARPGLCNTTVINPWETVLPHSMTFGCHHYELDYMWLLITSETPFLCSVRNPTCNHLMAAPDLKVLTEPCSLRLWNLPEPPPRCCPYPKQICLKGKFHYSCTFRFFCTWDRSLELLILPTWHYALRKARLLGDPSLPKPTYILVWPIYPWGSCWFCEPWDTDLHSHTSPFPQQLSTPGSRIQV